MSDIIYLSNVRLSFPALAEAKSSVPNGPLKFAADFLIHPTDNKTSWDNFMMEVGKVAAEKWKEHAGNVLNLIQNDRKFRCYGSGNERVDKKTFKPYLGYENAYYVSANSDDMPQMIDQGGKVAEPGMAAQSLARKLYGGCYVNAAVRPWAQDNQHGRAIRCQLIAVQFCRDGEAFGEGTPDVSGMFTQVQGAQPVTGGFSPLSTLPGFMG
jgi:hypothetical protein